MSVATSEIGCRLNRSTQHGIQAADNPRRDRAIVIARIVAKEANHDAAYFPGCSPLHAVRNDGRPPSAAAGNRPSCAESHHLRVGLCESQLFAPLWISTSNWLRDPQLASCRRPKHSPQIGRSQLQKRKRNPTVGAMLLRWRKPLANPPFTCVNMMPE
jgi:hypothetical protein